MHSSVIQCWELGRLCVYGVRKYMETLYFLLNFPVSLKKVKSTLKIQLRGSTIDVLYILWL
jgi:hypothetical protein